MRSRRVLMIGMACAATLGALGTARAEAPGAGKPGGAAAAEPAKGAAPPPASAGAHERPTIAGDTVHWDKLTVSEKRKHMKTVVLPEMKKVFQEFDAKAYAKFDCKTCHGDKTDKTKFKMPNAELPQLPPPSDRAAFMALAEKKPDTTKFMGTKVKPTMARLLGLEELNITTKVGFGCYACHTKLEGPKDASAGGGMMQPKEGASDAGKHAAPGAATSPAAPVKAAVPAKPAGGGW